MARNVDQNPILEKLGVVPGRKVIPRWPSILAEPRIWNCPGKVTETTSSGLIRVEFADGTGCHYTYTELEFPND